MSPLPPIILASASPRRARILKMTGIPFTVIEPKVEESIVNYNVPEVVKKNAVRKVGKVSDLQKDSNCLIIGADTLVVHEGVVFGKPLDHNQAFSMLKKLSDNVHTVYTGVAVAYKNRFESDFSKTYVYMTNFSGTDINKYLKTEEYVDKAGAYGIQGSGSLLVRRIEGCYYNVVGLPLQVISDIFRRFNFNIMDFLQKSNY
jgi:septum formation protein